MIVRVYRANDNIFVRNATKPRQSTMCPGLYSKRDSVTFLNTFSIVDFGPWQAQSALSGARLIGHDYIDT